MSLLLTQLRDEGLDAYASSPMQTGYRKNVVEHGGVVAAARALGVHHSTIGKSMQRLLAHAAKQGYAPTHDQTHPAPPGAVDSGRFHALQCGGRGHGPVGQDEGGPGESARAASRVRGRASGDRS